VAAVLSVSLVATGVSALAPSAPLAASSAAAETAADVVSRPDLVSAAVTARVSGHRVEDLSQRDEFTRVYANPDGTWSSETASEPESVQDDQGDWHAIDTTLVPRDGGLAPAYAVSDVVLSDGGDKTLASMTVPTESGATKQLDWRWPTTLPTPVVDGNTATYEGAISGGDLVVTATRTGFSHSVVLDAPPSVPIDLTLPIVTHGADLVDQAGGGVAIETASGGTLLAAPAPLMWDSSKDAGGQPQVAPVDTTIGHTASGTPTLTLSPDQAWLTDPTTVYPVTIDPTLAPTLTADTWVQNADYTSSQNSSTELRAGTYDGGSHVARSFLKFNANGKWDGKHILSANMTLRNWYSGSCTGAAIRVQRLTESWSATGITWANQPGAGTGYQADYNPAKGYNSSCAGGDASWNLHDMVQDWADGFTNNGIRIKAVDEGSIYTWRKYRSGDYGGSVIPRLDVTYNSYPNTAGTPYVIPGNAGYTTDSTPVFKAWLYDADGGTVRGKVEVYQGTSLKWTGWTGWVAPGQFGQVTAATLPDGAYTVKVLAQDGTDNAKSYSTSTAFTVDTSKPTATVTATAFTNGQWTTQVPTSNTFTFHAPSDTKSFSYTEDGITQLVKSADANGDGTVSWLPKNGSHTLTVTPTDKAGNTGAKASFSFGVGPASFTTPNPDARSTGVFPIQVSGPSNATSATLSWRYAGQTSWNPMTGTTKDGSEWTGAVANTSDGMASTSGALIWDATAQEDNSTADPDDAIEAPKAIELRSCFNYTGTPAQICSSSLSIQLVPSAFDGNFPVTTVGPATVAIFTGEATLSDTDAVDQFAGVGRTFSTFDAATTSAGAFGPGWSTSLLTVGDGDVRVIDQRSIDRTLVLIAPGGGSEVFTPSDPNADVVTPIGAVAFQPTGIDDGSRVKLDGTTLTLTRLQGPVTTWSMDTSGEWALTSAANTNADSDDPQVEIDTTAPGYPTWIAQTLPGVSTQCTETVQQPGCRGLKVVYSGSAPNQRVTRIDLVSAGSVTEAVANYEYTDGLLSRVCGADPDGAGALAPLCATYEYDTTTVPGRTLLKKATPPGRSPGSSRMTPREGSPKSPGTWTQTRLLDQPVDPPRGPSTTT
jgi:hypothetical protein